MTTTERKAGYMATTRRAGSIQRALLFVPAFCAVTPWFADGTAWLGADTGASSRARLVSAVVPVGGAIAGLTFGILSRDRSALLAQVPFVLLAVYNAIFLLALLPTDAERVDGNAGADIGLGLFYLASGLASSVLMPLASVLALWAIWTATGSAETSATVDRF